MAVRSLPIALLAVSQIDLTYKVQLCGNLILRLQIVLTIIISIFKARTPFFDI